MESTNNNLPKENQGASFEPWGNVTSPSEHNPARFRYLVHAINPVAKPFIAQRDVSIIGRENYDNAEGDQAINLYDFPEKIADRVAVSCSFIAQDKYATWGEAGLIVEAPPHNVIITSPADIGTIGSSKRLLKEQARRHSLLTDEELLQRSIPDSYNEVLVLANEDGKKVRLAGFFYRSTAKGEPIDDALFKRIRIHAERLRLPLVAIAKPSRYAEDKVIDNQGKLQVVYRGKYYVLQGPEEFRFTNRDYK